MLTKKKSASNVFSTVFIAKRWNKFFYRTPKGAIDPDSEWRQQHEQHKQNKIYKMVNFAGEGDLVDQYDKGNTTEEKKKYVQEYFKNSIEEKCLCSGTQWVSESDYQEWHSKQRHKAKEFMRQKKYEQKGIPIITSPHNEVKKDDDNITVYSLDSVVTPYKTHEIKWKLDHRGAIGETPMHLLFLNGSEKHIAIAEALLEKYPDLALDIYEGVEYYGETCLHFAIIQNNVNAVEILLKTNKVDLYARARGKFFVPVDIKRGDVKLRKHKFEGYAYYGEYPLSFAASIGNQKIYDMLIRCGCDPECKNNSKDRFGNGVLHLAVIHNQLDMYYHALKHPAKPADPNLPNENGLTPLALAAKLGKTAMFEKILEISSRRYWSYNTVTCAAYPLISFDTIGPHGETNWNSALMMIVRGRKDSHLDMISNHVVHQLLEEKWQKFGLQKFIRLLAAFILHIICLTVAVYLRPDEVTDLRYGTSAIDIARYVFESLVIFICLSVIMFAGKEIYLEHFSGFWQNLVSIPSRIAYVISVVLLLLCVPMRFLELYNIEEWFLVFAVPGLWTYLLFFLRNSSLTGPSITIIFRIFSTDVVRFAVIYEIVLLTCALAFFYQFEGENVFAFQSELGTIMTLFQMSFGEFDESVVLQGKYQALTIVMFVFFMIIVHILLLNMLIAMVTRTFEKITEKAEKVWRRQWASMVVTLERSHSQKTKLAFQDDYSINIESKRLTQDGDAETDYQHHVQETEKRGLMVVYHQKMSESQRKRDIKRRIKKVGHHAIKERIPPPTFQVKNMAGLDNLIRNAPTDSLPGTSSKPEKLSYSDEEEDTFE